MFVPLISKLFSRTLDFISNYCGRSPEAATLSLSVVILVAYILRGLFM